MARLLVPALSFFLLFIAAAFATVSGRDEQAALRAEAFQSEDSSRGNTSTLRDIQTSVLRIKGSPEFVPSSMTTGDEKVEEDDANDDKDEGEVEVDDDEEEQEEPEGDEYEDELKALAESHEAMSKDEIRNMNMSVARDRFTIQKPHAVQSFDSHEESTENLSDENVASNEAIVDELAGREKDKEVAELLKYKKERITGDRTDDGAKAKRVPTVKKELSTQKEILAGGNETQLPKIMLSSDKVDNDLAEDLELVQRRDLEKNELMEVERNGDGEAHEDEDLPAEMMALDDRYSEAANQSWNPRKLGKRQETAAKEMLPGYIGQQRQRHELPELGVQESALAESLLEVLVKLAKDPSRWERVHQLLRDVENDLEYTKNELETRKRNFEMEILRNAVSTTAATPTEGAKKGRKKPNANKKKKPRRQRVSSTAATGSSASPAVQSTTLSEPLVSRTTETPWRATTPVQWRLVAERLFGPPWPRDLQDDPGNIAKIRYSVASKPRTLPTSVLNNNEDNGGPEKNKNNLNTLSSERQSLLLGNAREYAGQPRRVHFGKVNTHQSGRATEHRELPTAYERETDHSDYDPPELAYQVLRYDEFSPESREYSRGRKPGNFRRNFGLQESNYAHNREYRPPNRDYAMSKSWPNLSFKYSRPWKPDERSLSPTEWSWRQPQNDMKPWSQRAKLWQIDRDYGQFNGAMDEGIEPDKPWDRQEQKQQQQEPLSQHTWEIEESNTWPIEKPRNIPSPWSQSELSKNYERENPSVSWEKSKNRSALNKSTTNQEMRAMPKISMKTWNSLTSDPATWPFKLPGAKPWPKDKNGKSYNPNAELVRKLGLDKQSRTLSILNGATKDEFAQMDAPKYDASGKINHFKNSQTNTQKAEAEKPSQNWSMMLSGDKEWSKTRNLENLPQNDDVNTWRGKLESPVRQPWNDKNSLPAVLPKIQSVGAWVMPADQSTWKSYEMKHADGLNENFTGRRWSTSRNAPIERPWPLKENDGNSWREGTGAKNPWISKINNGNTWSTKSNPSESWTSALNEEEPWNTKVSNSGSWDGNLNKGNSWKGNVDAPWNPKVNNADTWSEKSRNTNPWNPKINEDGGAWTKPNSDAISWQQKVNEEWTESISKGTVPSSNWSPKWKQFAYHRVTAMPMTKPGTTADASAKSRNAFVAVSAVSSPKDGANSWRKNDIEETVVAARNENDRSEDPDHPSSQLHAVLEPPIFAWKKDGSADRSKSMNKTMEMDPLENQLETLKDKNFWPYKDSGDENAEIHSTSSSSVRATGTTAATNSTSSNEFQSGVISKENGRYESHRQGNTMK